ncbi:MAG: MinD/ParA family protein, partial [Candidatus Hadarchaeales archaeon]
MSTVFSVVGTKGGVSKTTVAMGVSIWMSLMRPHEKILLVDGDLHVRSVELKMCPTKEATLYDVMIGKRSWKDAVYTCQLASGDDLLYPNLAIMPAGGRFISFGRGNSNEKFLRSCKILDRTFSEMRKKFSRIIIDTPASVSYEHILLTGTSDKILYVCEANDDSISSTLATAQGLSKLMDVEAAGVVISKVMKGISLSTWMRKASKIAPVLGTIPFDEAVDVAFRENLPVVAAYPKSPASLAIKKIARKLTEIKCSKRANALERL